MLERVTLQQLLEHLKANGLLPSVQSAYRKCHSTETAMARVLSDILMALDRGDVAALALLDLSAASDTVDHSILLRHLRESYGISGVAGGGWNFSVLQTGFLTLDELTTKLRKLEEKTKYVFTICRSISVKSGNKVLKSDEAPRFKQQQWVHKQATVAC